MASATTDTSTDGPDADGPLSGLRVVDLSTTAAGAHATQFLAEAGADVVLVEPPGGSPLRSLPAWPVLAGGKRSVVLDLHDEHGRASLAQLLAGADVLVTTMRPSAAARLGLTPDELAQRYPRLVSCAITGWGSSGPLRDIKGYEGLVMAKLGYAHAKRRMVLRDGPAFVSVPYASWGAAQTAIQGILAALLERQTSGRGQHVEADLARGVGMIDTWNWFAEMISIRWPGAYESIEAYSEDGQPQSPITYPLLIAPTKDGAWLQFAQTEPRLFAAMLQEFGLMPLMSDPKWKGLPRLESQERRTELWELMINEVGRRTLAEWQQVFEDNPNISAEVFRSGPEALDHPQIQHDGRDVTVSDPERGPVRRPAAMVYEGGRPLTQARPAPRLSESGDGAETVADGTDVSGTDASDTDASDTDASDTDASGTDASGTAEAGLPLAGVTILDLGLMFAGPFGATILTDLGARVFKVETLAGDTIRNILPFPESGGARVMQGKHSIQLDLRTDEGRNIVHELARRSDVVLCSYRAGGAARAGVDAATLRELNPDLVYVNAPGYGTDGPFGARPAYAPSIGAAVGFALTDAPDAAGATETLEDKKQAARRLSAAHAIPVLQADGVSALGVASTMLLGLLARARGRALDPLTVTMLGTGTHMLVDRIVDYRDRPASPTVDPDGFGFSPLYRLYRAGEGWVFLAAPAEQEWDELTAALADEVDLGADERFATAESRAANEPALARVLGEVFARRSAADWERVLTAAGVGCVQVAEAEPGVVIQTDQALADEYTVPAVSPVFEQHLRVAPPYRFSRSTTQALGGCLAGEHTDVILRELGYDDAAIADLRSRSIVAG